MIHNGWSFTLVLMGLTLVAAPGCHQSAYEAKVAQRQKRIDKWWTTYLERENESPRSMEELIKLGGQLDKLYAARLEATLEMIRHRHDADIKGWNEKQPERDAMFKKMIDGNPQNIPGVWRRMTQ